MIFISVTNIPEFIIYKGCSDSSLDVKTINESSFPNLKENFTKPFDSRELILGLIIGILIGLCLVSYIQANILTFPHLSKSHPIDNSRMGDTKMKDGDDLIDYNEVEPEDLIAGRNPDAPNQGNGNSTEDPDWAFDDEQKAQSQAKFGDEIYYEPFTPKPLHGSVEDIQHRLRVTGIRLRKDLNRSLLTDPKEWTALRRPASLHTAQRTLAEMLMSIPSADQEHFHELGDGYVYMPLHAMEKYLYPTLCVMQHLHSHKDRYDYIPGGVESMIVYSYFLKGGGIPQNRTERDLRVLRNTVFPAGSDLPDQLRINAEVTEGISTCNSSYVYCVHTSGQTVRSAQGSLSFTHKIYLNQRIGIDKIDNI
jgi:hypothetical protein